MKRYSCLAVAIGVIVICSAAETLAGISDAAVLFLRIAPGARSAGMGEAFVAISDDASATHWNPAGLGEYPLAHAWYEFKLADDSHLRDLARKALKNELPADFFEKFLSWQIKGNQLGRYENGEWKYSESISIDPSQPILTNLARRASTSDKELFKEATREISQVNTGISFGEINDLRGQLLKLAGSDQQVVARLNEAIEHLLTVWQDLRIHSENFRTLQTNVQAQVGEVLPSASRLDSLLELATRCETEVRPETIDVPYPVLLSVWKGWEVPWEQNIERIAVMENSVPTDNFSRYDIWALTNFGLMRFDGVKWEDGDDTEPKKGDKLSDIISRALGTAAPEVISPRLELVAEANNVISKEKLLEIKAATEAALPDSFESREEFTANLSNLEELWRGCLLDSDRLLAFVQAFNDAYRDSLLTQNETDRLVFALEKSIRTDLPRRVRFPFKAVFDGEITDLAVDSKTLWAATTNGLYRYNGRAWQKFATDVPSETIWCVESVKRGQLWIGTNSGIKHFSESKWTSYGVANGINSLPIKHIYVKNERMVWAAADKDLYYFDGTSWMNSFKYTTTVTDSAETVFRKFYGPMDELAVDMQTAQLQMSHPDFYANPKADEVIEIPFKPLFEGEITALAVDNQNILWVGTDLGVKRFDGKSWYSFGYKPVKVEREMTIEELAREYLKTSDPEKVSSFVSIIKRKNTVKQEKLAPGRVIYVYANPAGSPVNSIYSQGDRVYIGSLFGTFSYQDGRWERYYHEGLHSQNTKDIVGEGGEMWFATSDRVVVFAHARKELSFTHSNWLPELASDLYYEFLSYVQPLAGIGTFGANVTFLSYGEIARTTEFSSDVVESFHSFDGALTLSYGTRASRNMAIGLSAKVIHSRLAPQGAGREIGEGTGTSFAVEGGLLYGIGSKLKLGAAVTNLGPDMSYIDAAQSDPLPRNIAVGFSYRLLNSPYNRLTLVGEVNKLLATLNDDFKTELKEAIENVGVEYWYGSLLALRAGYVYDSEGQVKTPTLGLGLQYKGKYRLDFAYIPSSETLPLANTLRTSLTVRL